MLDPPPDGSCGAENAPLVIATSALNTAGDVFVFSLPIAMLSQLQLSRANKFSLFAVFATGAFAIAAGIVRLTRSLEAIRLGADVTWITADIYIWTAVEAGVGLICACLPVIGPLFGIARKLIVTYMSDYSSRSRRSHQQLPSKSDSSWFGSSNKSQRSTVKTGDNTIDNGHELNDFMWSQPPHGQQPR
jgi:hypothetical protein